METPYDPNKTPDPPADTPFERVTVHGDIIQDDSFSYEGYQVVRGEFFAHLNEPSVTFNRCKVYVNTACLKRLPSVEYVQILVHSTDKKLAIRPCREDDRDSFLWRTPRRRPRQITCRVFFAKLVHLMEWNPDYRYKLLGKLIKNSNDEFLFLFDLTATEIYPRVVPDGENPKPTHTPIFPAEWQNQFGLPVEEHRKLLQVDIFDGYTVFGMKDTHPSGETPESSE